MAKKPRKDRTDQSTDPNPNPSEAPAPEINEGNSTMPSDQTDTNTEASAPANSILIQGLRFSVPPVYSEGHVLNALEANALNQTRAENLRNNFAGRIKTQLDALNKDVPEGSSKHTSESLDHVALEAEFAAYAQAYSFASRQARAPADPVAAEAHKIARAQITAALKGKNVDLKSVPAEKMAEYIETLLGRRPEIMVEAKRRVEAIKDISSSAMADMLG